MFWAIILPTFGVQVDPKQTQFSWPDRYVGYKIAEAIKDSLRAYLKTAQTLFAAYERRCDDVKRRFAARDYTWKATLNDAVVQSLNSANTQALSLMDHASMHATYRGQLIPYYLMGANMNLGCCYGTEL